MLEFVEQIMLIALVVAPIPIFLVNLYVWQVYLADSARPRNRILWVMASNGFIVFLSSLGIAPIAADAAFEWFDLPDWWVVVLIVMIMMLYTVPFRHAATVSQLARTIRESEEAGPETQNQREDREFGEQRRALESEHNRVDSGS